jgi:glucose/arabinose dehydrogenase
MATRHRAPTAVAALAAALLAMAACTAAPPVGRADDALTVADGLVAPWSVVAVDGAVIVSERDSGRILRLAADGTAHELATVPDVVHGGEGGLLGLAFDGASGLYAASTGPGGNRVQRFEITGGGDRLALGAPATILDGLPAARIHNGGRIAFGPDGMLYVTAGDAGDPRRAQDPDDLGGKILRITGDGAVPADNPDPRSPVYSSGHRNVQGLAWTADGRMFASEFGQNTWDELNEIVPGGNYGWPVVEGDGGASQGFADPVATWPTADASPSGIAVVGDRVVLANLRGERLRVVPVENPSASIELLGGAGRLRDAVAAPDGGVWVLTSNTDGRGRPRPGDDRLLLVPEAALREP